MKELVEKGKQKQAEQDQSILVSPTNTIPAQLAVEAASKADAALDSASSNSVPEIPEPGTEDPKTGAEPVGPMISGTPVATQPVNPFRLATSLFMTGNIEAARKSYEAGLANATPDEKLWLKCFIGCCYRLEGDFASAESAFREVTNDGSATFPVDYGKWCLKYLQQRRNSLEQYQYIEAEIDGILKDLEQK